MGKRLLLLIPLILVLSGCTVNYNLEVNGNSLTEIINGTATKEEITIGDNVTDVPLIYDLINNPQTAIFNDENELYIKNINNNGNELDYTFSYVYHNNFAKSKLINSCFQYREIYETNEVYHVKLYGEFYCLYTDSINVKVISNNKVVNSNAKKVKGNVYSWVIDKPSNVNIQLDISKTESFAKTKKKSNAFRIVSFIILILLSTVVFFLYKNKNSDN